MDKVKAIELVETVENAVTAYNDFAKANELETMTYNGTSYARYAIENDIKHDHSQVGIENPHNTTSGVEQQQEGI